MLFQCLFIAAVCWVVSMYQMCADLSKRFLECVICAAPRGVGTRTLVLILPMRKDTNPMRSRDRPKPHTWGWAEQRLELKSDLQDCLILGFAVCLGKHTLQARERVTGPHGIWPRTSWWWSAGCLGLYWTPGKNFVIEQTPDGGTSA